MKFKRYIGRDMFQAKRLLNIWFALFVSVVSFATLALAISAFTDNYIAIFVIALLFSIPIAIWPQIHAPKRRIITKRSVAIRYPNSHSQALPPKDLNMIRQAKKPLGAYWQLIAGMIIWILLDALFSRTLISNDLALAAYAITVILTIIVIIRAVAKFKEESYDAARAKTSITKNVMIGHNRMSVDKDTVFGRDVYHQDDAIGNESEESGKLKKNDDE